MNDPGQDQLETMIRMGLHVEESTHKVNEVDEREQLLKEIEWLREDRFMFKMQRVKTELLKMYSTKQVNGIIAIVDNIFK